MRHGGKAEADGGGGGGGGCGGALSKDTTGPRVSADKVLRVELCEGRPLKYGVRGTGLDTSERVNSSPSDFFATNTSVSLEIFCKLAFFPISEITSLLPAEKRRIYFPQIPIYGGCKYKLEINENDIIIGIYEDRTWLRVNLEGIQRSARFVQLRKKFCHIDGYGKSVPCQRYDIVVYPNTTISR
ncbi:hypothetical protein HZH66_001630 [Vespula vulgaris]|uniref:Uncharacterized protein n=1 Tax=Vespula vulgaris TaxID=7454 RepID=A0A834KRH4_VESVU|nr:hypothetical protein HZH66_001630 [Vespula vulgaris]